MFGAFRFRLITGGFCCWCQLVLSHGNPEKIGARIGQPSQPKSQQCIINPYQRGFAHLPQPDQNTGRVGDHTGCSKSRCNFGVMQRFVINKQDTKKCQRKNSLSAYQPTAGLFDIQKTGARSQTAGRRWTAPYFPTRRSHGTFRTAPKK